MRRITDWIIIVGGIIYCTFMTWIIVKAFSS